MICRKFETGILVVLLTLCVIGAEAAGKMQYKLKLEKGQKYYLCTSVEQQISQTIMGQAQEVGQDIGMGIDFDVNDVDGDGNMWIRYTYRWVKFIQKSAMGQMEYDSSKKDSPVTSVSRPFAALLGEGLLLKMTPEGRVTEVRDIEKMRNNIRQKFSSEPMSQQMMDTVDKLIDEQSIKESTSSLMVIYPDEPVGIGDSWSKTIAISTGSPMVMENKWTLKDRKDGVAIIDVNSVVKPNLDAKPMEMGTMKMNYQLSGTQTGRMEMEESTGRIIKSRMNQDMSGQIVMSDSSGQGMPDMTVPMKIKSVIIYEMTQRKEQVPGPAPSPVPN